MGRSRGKRVGEARALRKLREARRRRHVQQLDVMEVLYRVYVVALFGGWGVALLAGVISDPELTERALDRLAAHGPAILGVVVALAVLAGLRSGARGGPLAIEAADLQHVLLAPIDRRVALRGPALRQLRTAGFLGSALGLVVAYFTSRRLPGPTIEWLACLAVFGAALPTSALGAAMIGSGQRVPRLVTNLLGFALLAWTIGDLALEKTTSPLAMLGELALWPLRGGSFAGPLVGVILSAAIVAFGLSSLGGLSLEAARRRAALTAQLRFAVAMQDIRAVVLLRRELASEYPRRLPWARLRSPRSPRWLVWRRAWQSVLRWPAIRVTRVIALGLVAGFCLVAGWDGTTPLLFVSGLVLFIAGLDVIEPLAQEVDHPMRRDLLPVRPDELVRRHLVVPATLMVGVVLVAAITMAAFISPARAAGIGAAMIMPTAILIACCAALSATNDPYEYVLAPEIAYAHGLAPIGLAGAATTVPVLAMREAERIGGSTAGAAVSAGLVLLLMAGGLTWWVGSRIASRTAVDL